MVFFTFSLGMLAGALIVVLLDGILSKIGNDDTADIPDVAEIESHERAIDAAEKRLNDGKSS